MFEWLKKRRAFALGQKAAEMTTGEIDNHITARVLPASQRFIRVFEERLTTIWDEPPSSPDPRARLYVELQSFKENLDTFIGEMRAEINIKTYKFDDLIDAANKDGSVRKHLDKYIAGRLTAIESTMFDEVESKSKQAIAEIERREKP